MGQRVGVQKIAPCMVEKGLKRTSQACASHGPHSDGASEARAGHRRTSVVGVGLGVFPKWGWAAGWVN